MARENQVSIKVLLDSEEAKQRLQELQNKLDSLLNRSSSGNSGSSSNGNGSGSSSDGGSGESNNPSSNKTNTPPMPKPEDTGRGIGRGFVQTLMNAGVMAGMARLFVKAMDLSLLSQTHSGESTYDINMKKATLHGGVGGSLGGAALGLAIAGPIGAVVGAALGGVMGSGQARFEQQEKQRLFSEQQILSVRVGNADSYRSAITGMSNQAFNKRVELTGDRESRIESYKNRFEEYTKEVQKYEDEIKELTTKGVKKQRDVYQWVQTASGMYGGMSSRQIKTGTEDYYEIQDANSELVRGAQKNANNARGIAIQAIMGGFNEYYMRNQIAPWNPSSFTDSYSSRGIYVGGGAGFDVGKANEPILNFLKEIVDTLKRFEHVGKNPAQMTTAEFNELSRLFNTYVN